MKKINTDVNYRTMAGNARLVIIAEASHNPVSYKYEAIRALKQLKVAGFTHFAMEMLPLRLKEKIEFYQRTGKGLDVIRQHFKEYWNRNMAAATGYGDLVQAANSLGMKIIPLDMTIDMMDLLDSRCDWFEAEESFCSDSHIQRNILWTGILGTHLRSDENTRIVAFMHRYHAFSTGKKHIGIDALMQQHLGVDNIKLIDYVGGIRCPDKRTCEGQSNEKQPLKNVYFYRKGSFVPSLLSSFTVHIPEKRVSSEGVPLW